MAHDLKELILKRINDNGPMSFMEFMQSALYEPGLGYYTRPETEIGKHGDFYTSPHAHRMFGAMLAKQCIECWQFMGSPDKFEVVEFGGGRGWLARDILDYQRGKPLYDVLSYTLMELNPSMIKMQQELLGEHKGKVHWAQRPDDCEPIIGAVVSNEVPDAFAVNLIEHKGGWKEVYIASDNGELTETLLHIESGELAEYINTYIPSVGDGYRTEVNLGVRKWQDSVFDMLNEGFVLTIDYGYPASDYYDPERKRGTLLCYRGHDTTEDYLSEIGRQDITAHVNFTDIRSHGDKLGLRTLGYTRQGIYLVSLGFDEVIRELYGDVPDLGDEMHRIQNLIMPGTMGDTHKVLLQYKGSGAPEPRGFAIKNELEKLG